MKVEKEARRDAIEYARSQMFYGEGAGIRRKLIEATVESKSQRDPVYGRAFRKALEAQDMAQHASKARVERKKIDRAASIQRNVRGILTGRKQSVNTALLVVGTAAYICHQQGWDKKLYQEGKSRYTMWKAKRTFRKSEAILVDFPIKKKG